MEFAFVVPILLLFLLTVVDFGLAMDHRLLLQHAVREGARTAATGASESEIVDVTADQAGMDPSDLTVTVCYEDLNTNGVADAGDDVRVDADFSYQLLFRVIDVSPPAIDMKPSADMRLERDAPLGAVC